MPNNSKNREETTGLVNILVSLKSKDGSNNATANVALASSSGVPANNVAVDGGPTATARDSSNEKEQASMDNGEDDKEESCSLKRKRKDDCCNDDASSAADEHDCDETDDVRRNYSLRSNKKACSGNQQNVQVLDVDIEQAQADTNADVKISARNLDENDVRNNQAGVKSCISSTSRQASNERKWMERFEELKLYKEKHGDCLVPYKFAENPQLGNWVKVQRREYNNLKLGKRTQTNEFRIRTLEDLGFIWLLRGGVVQVPWKQRFEELVAYKEEHGE